MNDSSISFVCLVLVVAASCAIVAFGENDESIVLGVAADLPQSICWTMQCSEGVPLPAEKGHRLIVGLLPTPQQLHPNPSRYVNFAICESYDDDIFTVISRLVLTSMSGQNYSQLKCYEKVSKKVFNVCL